VTDRIRIDSNFFRVYRIPLLRGRSFQPGDGPTDVVIGERLASLLWPGEAPLGRSFADAGVWHRVIGVAREVTVPTLDRDRDRPEYYVAEFTNSALLSLRCQGPCPSDRTIVARVREMDSGVRLSRRRSPRDYLDDQLILPRAAATGGILLAGLAMATVAGGLFGVLTLAVRSRRRELGIRTALGGARTHIAWIVVRDVVGLLGAGVLLGAPAAWVLARVVASLQYGVGPADPATVLAVFGGVAAISVAAVARPILEAFRVSPLELLRSE
jgi:hypothetical protein